MVKIKKSEYVKISRTIIRKLFDETCFGKGSMYLDNLKRGIPKDYVEKIETVIESLTKQDICRKKKKEHGWKYYLNIKKLDKIKEIIKEKGDNSIIPILLFLQ